jgi:hypothetical protein
MALVRGTNGTSGYAPRPNPGVWGDAGVQNAEGVIGSSKAGVGVLGLAFVGDGVVGRGTNHGVAGTSQQGAGVYGEGPIGIQAIPVAGAGHVAISASATAGQVAVDAGTDGGRAIQALANTGVALYAEGLDARAVDATTSGDADVIHAEGSGDTTSAVYGKMTGGGWAGYFDGRVRVAGNLEKAGGGFVIDHPLDPERKYLCHSFVESPDMKNVYDGVVELDDHGEAWVELPKWFESLNSDFRYQLTPLATPAPDLHVGSELQGGRFKISGGRPTSRVSWQITGIRVDAWARTNRIEVEPLKPEWERATESSSERRRKRLDDGALSNGNEAPLRTPAKT